MVGLWKKTHKFAPLSGRSTTWWPTSGGHPVKALQQFCFGHTRACVAELAGNQNVVAAVEDGSGLVPHEILVLRLGGLGSKKVVTSGSLSGCSGSLSSLAFLFKFR